jgi:aspartyl-tRNA(Asn)/glutamyl-tRNA(Gln) amidotransferase subunit C
MPSATETVLQTAALARLSLSGEEAQRLGPQFQRILEAFQVLASLDVGDAQAMARASSSANVFRADEPADAELGGQLLARAPERVGDFFSVPKTVGGPS